MAEKLSTSQKLVKFFSSEKKFEAVKAESLLWGFDCTNCNHRTSIWEMGGVRSGAKGNPKRVVVCNNCGHRGMHQINKQE